MRAVKSQQRKVSRFVVITTAVHLCYDKTFCDGLDVVGKKESAACAQSALQQTPVVAAEISNTEAGLRPVQNVHVGESLQTSIQASQLSCRLHSRSQAPQRRQRSLPVAATADAGPQRQSGLKVRSTGHSAEDQKCSHALSATL